MKAPEGRHRRVRKAGLAGHEICWDHAGLHRLVSDRNHRGRELRMSNMFTLGWIWTDPKVSRVRQAERRAHADSRGIVRRAHAAGDFMSRRAWSGGL